MGHKAVIRNARDCKDPRRVTSFMRKNGVLLKNGKGDHVNGEYNGHHITFYTGRELSIGVAHQVFDFLVRTKLLGPLAILVLGVLALAII